MKAQEFDAVDIGRQLGADGVDSVVSKVEHYCAHEERRIMLSNHPSILGLKAEFSLLRDEERGIEERLRHAPPPGDLRHHRRKAIYAWTITAVLTVSGFLFALLSFDPFQLGWKSYLYCLGIAAVAPFLVEKLLDASRMEAAVKILTIVAATAGIASLMLLAVIRGDLLAQQVENTPTVVIDNAQPMTQPANTFYGSTLSLLQLATVLLSLAMELGAGLALREAWSRLPQDSEDWQKLREELRRVHQRMVTLVAEVTALEDEAALFAARFWRDFYGSMLTHIVRSAMTKLLVLLLGIALIPHAYAATKPHLNLVVAIDLTKSVAVKGPDGRTEFQKNVTGVTRLLAQIPAGAHVTVIGITDHSFAQPYILLSASMPDDPGYFGERLNAGHNQLTQAWKMRSTPLRPRFTSTDILGALLLASQIFSQQPANTSEKMLVLFSDMRHHTHDLDLESPAAMSALQSAKKDSKIPPVDLHQVQVYALGADGAGTPTAYWENLERFWDRYFQGCGASLNRFSVLRTLPQFQG